VIVRHNGLKTLTAPKWGMLPELRCRSRLSLLLVLPRSLRCAAGFCHYSPPEYGLSRLMLNWGGVPGRVGLMRCMTCGDDMVLTQTVPAETGIVEGFENQTLECGGCGEAERRFTFAGGVAGSAAPEKPTPSEPRRNRQSVQQQGR
jgi:hypothetical protein